MGKPIEKLTENDLPAHSTIQFSRPLNEEALDRMLTHLGDELNARIAYTVERTKQTGRDYGEGSYAPDCRAPFTIGVGIHGSMSPNSDQVRTRLVTMEFKCFRDTSNEDYTTFNGMSFGLTPGWNVSDYLEKGELHFMQATREAVDAYMKSQ